MSIEKESLPNFSRTNASGDDIAQLRAELAYYQQQVSRQALLNQIVQAMRGTLVLDDIMETTVNQLHDVLQVSRSSIIRPDSCGRMTVCHASRATKEQESLIGSTCPLAGYYSKTLLQGEAIFLSEIDEQFPPDLQAIMEDYEIGALAIIPLMYQQCCLGGISLHQCGTRRDWTTSDREFLSAIADHCAVAIHQAELHQQLQADIAERIQVEDSIKAQADFLQNIVDVNPNIIYVKDRQDRYVLVNQAFATAHKMNVESVVGKTTMQLHPNSADTERFIAQDRAVLTTREPLFITEEASKAPTGDSYWFQTIKQPLLDKQGRVSHLLCVSSDITERKLALDALRDSEEKFRQLAENIRDVFWLYDKVAAKLLYISPAYERVWGNSCDSLYENPYHFLEAIHPDDRERVRMAINLAHQHEDLDIEFRVVRPNGEVRWIQNRGFPIHDSEGEIYRFAGVAEDITTQKQAEIALRQFNAQLETRVEERTAQLQAEIQERQQVEDTLRVNQQQLQAILDHAGCAMIVTNTTGIVEAFNPAAQRLLGYTPQEVVGKATPELWHDSSEVAQRAEKLSDKLGKMIEPGFGVFMAIACHDVSNDTEWTYIRKDGSPVPVLLSVSALRDASGTITGFLGIASDITTRKQAEADMRKALERERELSELRSSFLSLVSHEFRTPLTTILSSDQILEAYSHRLSDERKQNHHRRIQGAVDKMTQLLDEVLLIGKAEAGKLKFNPKPINLIGFCEDLVEGMQVVANNQKPEGTPQHQLHFVSHGNCPNARMDEKLLGHILTNLLSNAIKYSPEGGAVQFDLTCRDSQAVFCIQDNGMGIPEDDLPQLFESFGRASNVGTIQGTGLGLAIVKKSVELHGGKIAVESTLGEGTTFTVTLPFVD